MQDLTLMRLLAAEMGDSARLLSPSELVRELHWMLYPDPEGGARAWRGPGRSGLESELIQERIEEAKREDRMGRVRIGEE
jgi:hypothetical protein